MTSPSPEEVWSRLVWMAEAICAKIEEFNPEVVLVMYKSGSVVWRAVETWWRMTRKRPLPPVVGANIGPSKLSAYDREGFAWYHLEYGNWIDTGHLIAWVTRQEQWLKVLRHRITAQSGLETPCSFLVVDDVISDGTTTAIVQGLLWALYPKAYAPLVAGMHSDWRRVLGHAWLQEAAFNPARPDNSAQLRARFLRTVQNNKDLDAPWAHLISGLANTDYDPFGWCPLVATHPVLTNLAAYMPAEVWLQFPTWVATTTRRMLERQLQRGIHPLAAPFIVNDRPWELQSAMAPPQCLLCALAWQQPWVSMGEAAERCNMRVEHVPEMVADCAEWDYLAAAEVDGVAGFSLGPGVEPNTWRESPRTAEEGAHR